MPIVPASAPSPVAPALPTRPGPAPFVLLVRFDLPDASAAAAFDRLAAETIPVIREREPGTVTYDPYEVAGESLARVFFEVYRDEQAHADHEQQPHTAAFLSAVRALVGSIRVERLSPAVVDGPAGRSGPT